MQYTYDFYVAGVRAETTTNVHDAYRLALAAEKQGVQWFVQKTTNTTNKLENIHKLDDLESDIVMIERRVWHDVETKKAMRWDPFDEAESQIHVKEHYDNNVKTAAAATKPRSSAIPPNSILVMGAAMQNGADKYGIFNWRDTTVSATVFYDAMMRHMLAWYNGGDDAPDSKVSHLGHIMANCAILLDAKEHGVFNDDRFKSKK